MEANPRVGMVGPRLLYPGGRLQHSAFRFPTLAQIWLDFFPLHGRVMESLINGRYPPRRYESSQAFAADFILGAAMMARGTAVDAVGLLDEQYFMYCEEIDWCQRFWRNGWPVYCCPVARVVHHEGASTRQFRNETFVALWESRFKYYRKWHSPTYRRLASLLVRLGLGQSERRDREAQLRGDLEQSELQDRLEAYRRVRLVAR
jgi:GT2 family glycosyltransferase